MVIHIQNLSKMYKLYERHIDRLKEAVHPFKKQYHRPFYALKNINLEVDKGEILGIIGRNGAGKSTLAKIISGVVSPSRGSCGIRGRLSSLLGLASGFNPELTGIENIYLNGTIKGFSKKEMDRRLDDIIAFADIGQFINQPLKNYSSGMQARLGFAVAINIDPEILILDEVLSVGDELFRRKCYAKMEELFKSGCTVLFISHSLATISQICSRAIFLDRGELLLDGPPKFVTMYYQKFLFTEPANMAEYRNELKELNKDEALKSEFMPEDEPGVSSTPDLPGDEEYEHKPIERYHTEEKARPFFIPNFVPKTTLKSRNYPVEILDPHIRTVDGRRVNALVMNEKYIYSFQVRFDMDAFSVGIGTPFKNEKGMVVTTHNLHGHYIPEVKKNTVLAVDCHFRCLMKPGNYYATAAVGSVIDGKRVVLTRIFDALVFKVQTTRPQLIRSGLVYCDQRFDIKEL